MEYSDFFELLTIEGQAALQAAQALQPQEANFLRDFSLLSRQYPPQIARAALETAILRGEAMLKFPLAQQMYFTRPALEQASSASVSSYRAKRFEGQLPLVDLGCSIGGDTLALAALGPTIGIDLDPLRLAMARANLKVAGLDERARFARSDLATSLPLALPPSAGLFFDPARRRAGRRVFSVRDYHPPLAIIQGWLEKVSALGVKISPGVDLDELSPYQAEIEFISLHGDLKEGVLWFGPLQTTQRRATVLPGPHTLAAPAGGQERLPISEPSAYIYEPDPSILRAGLVETLGAQLGAAQMDPDIAYLTAGSRINTPFARVWAVEGWLPFNLKRLRAALRARGIGRVTVKKRGSPIQPEDLIRDLRLPARSGGPGRVLFLTHLRGRPVVVIAFEN